MNLIVAVAGFAAFGLLAYIRLVPSDPAVWHISVVTAEAPGQGDCAAGIKNVRGGARAACLFAEGPDALLARLDRIALASPRTTRLAGTPQSGRITWITRSTLIGYPDYTTVEATPTPAGTRLDIHARQRFGRTDFNVNAARLRNWLKDF